MTTSNVRVSRIRLDTLVPNSPPGAAFWTSVAARGNSWAWHGRAAGTHGVSNSTRALSPLRAMPALDTVLVGSLEHPELPAVLRRHHALGRNRAPAGPRAVLNQAHARLAPGGIIAIRTANIRSATFARNPLKWWAFGVDHRFYFSPKLPHGEPRVRRASPCVTFSISSPLERPEKPRRSLASDPRHVVRHLLNYARYGSSYWTSLMTVIGRKTAELGRIRGLSAHFGLPAAPLGDPHQREDYQSGRLKSPYWQT